MSTFVREEDINLLERVEPVLDIDTGRYSNQAETSRIIRGSVQPTTGEDLDRLPDGVRSIDIKTIFTHEQLEDQTVLLIKNKRYIVFKEVDWDSPSATLPHYMYLVYKEAVR